MTSINSTSAKYSSKKPSRCTGIFYTNATEYILISNASFKKLQLQMYIVLIILQSTNLTIEIAKQSYIVAIVVATTMLDLNSINLWSRLSIAWKINWFNVTWKDIFWSECQLNYRRLFLTRNITSYKWNCLAMIYFLKFEEKKTFWQDV